MKSDNTPAIQLPCPPSAPSIGMLMLFNGLLLIGGIAAGLWILVSTDDNVAVGISCILVTAVQCGLVNVIIHTREQVHALRLEQAWVIQQGHDARTAMDRHGECLDWLVQQQADTVARTGGAANRPQRIPLTQT